MRIGDKIKVLLDRRGMTQRELAKRIGITEASMSRYACNARIPKGPLIAAMAKELRVSTDELLGLADDPMMAEIKAAEVIVYIPAQHPEFMGCDGCVHAEDKIELCVLRKCIHAIRDLEECFVPRREE